MQMQSQPIEPTTAPSPLPNGDEDLLHFGGETFVLEDIWSVTVPGGRGVSVGFILRHEGTNQTITVDYTALGNGKMRAHTTISHYATTQERHVLAQILIESNADIQKHFWALAQISLGEA